MFNQWCSSSWALQGRFVLAVAMLMCMSSRSGANPPSDLPAVRRFVADLRLNVRYRVASEDGHVAVDLLEPEPVGFAGTLFKLSPEHYVEEADLIRFGESFPRSMLERLWAMSRLRRLDLRTVPVRDDDLVKLSGLTELRYLNLESTKISGTGLRHLATLKKLQTLILYGTNIQDESLVHLLPLPDLRRLDLSNTVRLDKQGKLADPPQGVTDAGLVLVAKLAKLESLILQNTNGLESGITDDGLKALRTLTRLKMLDLTVQKRISDAGLAHLKAFPELRELNLSSTRISDAGLEHLRGLRNLQTVYVDDTSVSDVAARRFQRVAAKCRIYLGSMYGGYQILDPISK